MGRQVFGSMSEQFLWELSSSTDLSIRTLSVKSGVVLSHRSVPVKYSVPLIIKTVGIYPLPQKRLYSSFICMFTSVVSVHSAAITKSLWVW